MRPRRSVTRTALRWVTHVLLALVVLEGCARLDDVLTWGAPFWGDYSEEMLFVNDSLGYHLKPNAQYQKWHVNRFGFRGPDITMAKPAGVVRIITVGASETFGLYESPGKEWPAQLQALLDSVQPGRYQVLNAAIPGISPGRIGHYFDRWLVRFSPDVVIFYPTPSFILPPPSAADPRQPAVAAAVQFTPRLETRLMDLYKRVAPKSLQTRIRRWLIDRAVKRHPAQWVLDSVPAARAAAFRDELLAFAGDVRSRGVQFVTATHATRIDRGDSPEEQDLLMAQRKQFPNRTVACLMESEVVANRLVRDIGAADGIPVVDIAATIPKSSAYFADFAHFTDAGAALAARAFLMAVRPDRAGLHS